MSNSEATILVELGASSTSDGFIWDADVDEYMEEQLYGEDHSQFSPGETMYIRVHHSSNVTIDSFAVTAGTIVAAGTSTRDEEDTAVFTSRDLDEPTTYTINKVSINPSFAYVGNDGYISQATGDNGEKILTGDVNKTPFVAIVSYSYNVSLYKVFIPDSMLLDGSYPLVVVFYITAK